MLKLDSVWNTHISHLCPISKIILLFNNISNTFNLPENVPQPHSDVRDRRTHIININFIYRIQQPSISPVVFFLPRSTPAGRLLPYCRSLFLFFETPLCRDGDDAKDLPVSVVTMVTELVSFDVFLELYDYCTLAIHLQRCKGSLDRNRRRNPTLRENVVV